MAEYENMLSFDKTYLICETLNSDNDKMNYIRQHFYGKVYDILDLHKIDTRDNMIIVYICYHDINVIYNTIECFNKNANVSLFVIKDFVSNGVLDITNYDSLRVTIISYDEIPININNVGVFVKMFFKDCDYFDSLTKEHEFQKLTESNKVSISYRKGIYITDVSQDSDNNLTFKLLRCSTNLDGPTDNFRKSDIEIIDKVKNFCRYIFTQEPDLNHVLAQVYDNQIVNGKNKKARISAHSDKTKDMTDNGVMAFCSFYSYPTNDPKNLTHLKFKRKNSDETFKITLYPNSIFLMPLCTNRLYTHEIFPPKASIGNIPTRLGYVIRCSKTKAIHKNNKTFIIYDNNDNNDNTELEELVEPSVDDIKTLKQLYYEENVTENIVNYGRINFSLNSGDYMKPIL